MGSQLPVNRPPLTRDAKAQMRRRALQKRSRGGRHVRPGTGSLSERTGRVGKRLPGAGLPVSQRVLAIGDGCVRGY